MAQCSLLRNNKKIYFPLDVWVWFCYAQCSRELGAIILFPIDFYRPRMSWTLCKYFFFKHTIMIHLKYKTLIVFLAQCTALHDKNSIRWKQKIDVALRSLHCLTLNINCSIFALEQLLLRVPDVLRSQSTLLINNGILIEIVI